MTIDEALARIEADRTAHMIAGPSDAAELAAIEAKLGRPLPEAFRAFLLRLGGGIFYQRHEVFGGHRTMIHDIELVPDLLSMKRRLEAEKTAGLREGLLPVHRAEGVVHLVELAEGPGYGRILCLTSPAVYADFASFLDKVVRPAS
jgi:hypothetical protein